MKQSQQSERAREMECGESPSSLLLLEHKGKDRNGGSETTDSLGAVGGT